MALDRIFQDAWATAVGFAVAALLAAIELRR